MSEKTRKAALPAMVAPPIKVGRELEGGHSVLRLRGALALGDATQLLATELDHAEKEPGGGTVVDLSDLRALDSTALGLLVGSLRRLRSSGREMALVNPSEHVALLLQMTQLDSVFPIRRTVAEALELLSHSEGEKDRGGPGKRI
jgi:anti-sigma B factor antagonist